MPVAGAKGMSMSGHSCDSTPFCPCRLLNLSPTTGLRLKRSSTLARCAPSCRPAPTSATCSTLATSSPFTLPFLYRPARPMTGVENQSKQE